MLLSLVNQNQKTGLLWSRSLCLVVEGISSRYLRYIAWLCIRDDSLRESQMCIVTGPRIELAITLIDRMKGLFLSHNDNLIKFDSKETVIELNGVHIEAYPSHHLNAMRGLKNVSFIYLDEADFFPPGQQQDARDVSERYIAKSNPWIVMVSTPNAPEGLFEKIQREDEKTCLYHRIYLDYTWGMGKIYTEEEIAQARASPSFEREYNLKFLGGLGNLIHWRDIDACTVEYDIPDNFTNLGPVYIGIDPGFSSSQFGIVVLAWINDALNVVHTDLFDKPLYTDALQLIRQLIQKYSPCKVYIDGSANAFIKELKYNYSEFVNYENLDPELVHSWQKTACKEPLIVPVNFNLYHREMAKHTVKVIAHRRVRIDPRFYKLITTLKSAEVKDDLYSLDKTPGKSAFNDLFDGFRLALLSLHSAGEF